MSSTMNRYNIRIDGEVMPNSYTYEELLLNEIFEFDDIEVKLVSESKWTNIKSFYFPEEHEDVSPNNCNSQIEEDGQNYSSNTQTSPNPQYTIDEFGQVVSNHNIGGGTSTTSPSGSTSTSSSQSTDNTGWKVFLTILAIIVFITITVTTGWGSIPAACVGYMTLRAIWGKDL